MQFLFRDMGGDRSLGCGKCDRSLGCGECDRFFISFYELGEPKKFNFRDYRELNNELPPVKH